MKRTRYEFGTAEADFQPGRASVDEVSPMEDPLALSDPLWGIYGDCRYLTDWSKRTDERLDALSADMYDLADRMNQLIVILALWFILTVAALGALIIVDL